jgi:hypothetical protein
MSLLIPLGIMTLAVMWYFVSAIKMIFSATNLEEFICNIIGTILFVYFVIWVLT